MLNIISKFKARIDKKNKSEDNKELELSISTNKLLELLDALIDKEVYKVNIIITHNGEDTPKSKESKERYFNFFRELHQYHEIKYCALIELWEENDEHNCYLIIESKDVNIFEKVANITNITFESINKIKFIKSYITAHGRGIQEPCGSKGKKFLRKP